MLPLLPMMKREKHKPLPTAQVAQRILFIRGQKVMLDSDLAVLYGVATKTLNRAVKRNEERFPEDFMFQVTPEEARILRYQIDTSNRRKNLRSQIVISKTGRGGRRYLPFVFTEHGVAMLSSVLNSPRAIQVNIQIMRAFARFREILMANRELSHRLVELERKYDTQFRVVFDAIRKLMTPPVTPRRRIGFHTQGCRA